LAVTASLAGQAAGQARPEPRPLAPPTLCTLVRSTTVAFVAPTPAPNAQTQLQLASTATGTIVAFRARTSDELVVLRVDDSFVRVGEDRVVAGPVTAFALASAPGGAVLAAAERVARDGRDAHDDVLLARLDANGNARNIPRSIARTTRCDGVAVRPSATGFVVAWGSLDGPTTSTVTLDSRGVPTARARVVVDASAPMMVALTGETRFAMTVRGASGSSLLHLDESGASIEAFTLSAPIAGIAALPSNVLVFSAAGDGLARWWPSSAVSEQPLPLSRTLGSALQLVSAHNDRAALIVVDDRNGREHIVRVTSDGGSALLASISGARGAVAPALDGSSLVSVTHNSAGGLDLARWTCPRVNPPTNSAAPTITTIGSDAAVDTDASTP
jgi:hypothetical protein